MVSPQQWGLFLLKSVTFEKKTMRHTKFTPLLLLFLITFSAQSAIAIQNDTIYNFKDNNNLKQGYWKKTYKNGRNSEKIRTPKLVPGLSNLPY